jgi:hypothetical protein
MPSCRERCVAGGPAVGGGRHGAAPAEAQPALQLEHPGGGGGGGRGGSGPTGRQCHGLRCSNMQVKNRRWQEIFFLKSSNLQILGFRKSQKRLGLKIAKKSAVSHLRNVRISNKILKFR